MEQAEQGGAVIYLDADSQVIQRITRDERGQLLQSPNDIALDLQNGGFYFTDPGPFMANTPGRVHYVNREGRMALDEAGSLISEPGLCGCSIHQVNC